MKKPWSAVLSPPKISSFEHEQKAKLLHYTLIAVFSTGLLGSVLNSMNGWLSEAMVLFILTCICGISFYLNHMLRYKMAAQLFTISFYIVISFLLYRGAGLYDSSLLAFPLLLICAAFLFDTRGLSIATGGSILAVFSIYLLQITRLFETTHPANILRLAIISVLFLAMAMVIKVVRQTWETNLILLKESYHLTLQGWARALEFRDVETAGHSERVTHLSVVIGEALGLDGEELNNLIRGSYLHDIGKMAIPDSILLKPGPLTESEWEIMKQHPVRAREFLSEIPFLQGAIPVGYSHHERWDGTGYPQGLSGANIPLVARIFAIVDNWDALTSDRPYRKAWSHEQTISYLREESGKKFDPEIVEVFIAKVLMADK